MVLGFHQSPHHYHNYLVCNKTDRILATAISDLKSNNREQQLEENKMSNLEAFRFPGDLKPGDPAPGGGLVGDVGDRAEAFVKAVIGRYEPGAIYNGRRVKKRNSEKSDRTKEGVEGTVLGSIAIPEDLRVIGTHVANFCYFIHWDGDSVPVFTTSFKVEEL